MNTSASRSYPSVPTRIFATLGVLLIWPGITPLKAQETGTISTAEAADADALPDLTEIMDALTEIRGLEFRQQVPAQRQSIEEWGRYIDEQLEKYFPPDRQEGMQAGLLRLGLLTEPIDIGQELKGALQSQAGAYYDPETDRFYYLMVGLPEIALQTIAAHELVHALQDQHFDLGERLDRFETQIAEGIRNDDQMLAFRALVEGEATYVHTIWQVKTMMGMDLTANKQMERTQLKMMADLEIDELVKLTQQAQLPMFGDDEDNPLVQAMKEIDTIPPYILHPLYAAYMKGAYFAMRLRHDGGWERVSAAYATMPASTEQMLDPDKFLGDRDDPTPLVLPELPELAGQGWEPVDAAVHGEFYLGLLLRNHLRPREEAAVAVSGWDGDVYRAYRNDLGQVMFVLATTWDTEGDAREFHDAYRSALVTKYPQLAAFPADEQPDGGFAYYCGDGLGSGWLVHRGREVFLVEGAPGPVGRRILKELAAQPVAYVE